jgi:hypothetical protein
MQIGCVTGGPKGREGGTRDGAVLSKVHGLLKVGFAGISEVRLCCGLFCSIKVVRRKPRQGDHYQLSEGKWFEQSHRQQLRALVQSNVVETRGVDGWASDELMLVRREGRTKRTSITSDMSVGSSQGIAHRG